PRPPGADRARRDRPRHPRRLVRSADGSFGLRKDDAAEPHRRNRSAHGRNGSSGRRGDRPDERGRPRRVAVAQHRVHLPVLQPDARADGGGERRAAAALGATLQSGAQEARRRRAQAGGPFRSGRSHAAPALGWPAAARRHRARHRRRSADHRRRRADRRPRSQERRRRARLAHDVERDARQDDRHGHARSPRRRARQDPAAARQGSAHVTLTGLALRNAFLRNKTRALLTVLGTMVAALAFVFLRTVLAAWYSSSEASAADRVVTRNAVAITSPLPLSYRDRIALVPGVTKVTFSNWFGGIYKDPKNFFAKFAIDAATALDVFNIRFLQGTKQDFLSDRNSCIVGKKLADRYGLKLGETLPLQGDIYPGERRLRLAGIIDSPDDESLANTMYFHWQRLNEGMPAGRKDLVGVYTITVADAARSPQVVRAIDALFANS